MSSKKTLIRLGIFTALAAAALVTAVFLIGNKESMFAKTFMVRAYFKNIEGLRKGASVRMSGINVGSVDEIAIAGDTTGRVEVKMKLVEDIRRFIKADTKALIETEGLVGNKVVTLQILSSDAPTIKDNGIIQGVEPLGFGAIIEETKTTLEYTKNMTKNLAEIIQKVNEGEGSVGRLLNEDGLYRDLQTLVQSADKSLISISTRLDTVALVVEYLGLGAQAIITNVNKVIIDIDTMIAGVGEGKGLLGALLNEQAGYDVKITDILNDVIEITEYTKSGAEKFSENMEALKRNWLFKDYFDQRGYYEKTEYEKKLDEYVKEIGQRLILLDKKIEALRRLEQSKQKDGLEVRENK